MKLISQIYNVLFYPMARVIVGAQSEYQRFRSLGKTPKIHCESPYAGQPILLLALYQKGQLRPDLIRLLQAAKAQGLYVLAVNTLKLKDPGAVEGLIDCYIERPNFGRDTRHAKDDAGALVLTDGGGTRATHRQQAFCAVPAHAGQDCPDCPRADRFCDRMKQGVDRRPVSADQVAVDLDENVS